MDSVLNRPLFAGKVSADPSGAITRQYQQRSIRPAGLPSLSVTKSEAMAADRSVLFSNALLAAAEEKVRMAQDRFENDPSGVNQQRYVDAVSQLKAAQKESEDVMSTYVPSPITSIKDRGVLDVEGPEAVVSQMTPEQLDIFNNLDRAANNPTPDMLAPKGPSGMEREAQGSRLSRPSGMETEAAINSAPDVPAPKVSVPGSPILERSTMEADARDRGPLISNPSEVATGLNAEDPVVREKTLADFMKEFTDAAPKYEGIDKNLMLAQIGFAIAAGESPNAMQNIANGLLAGSDMMIKDKAAKNEFDRQVQLSAMQYGLDTTKAEQERGRKPLSFVAIEDTVYKGKPVKKGQSVMIPYSDIERNDGMVPAGFGDSTMVTALSEKQSAVLEFIEESRKEKNIEDTFAESQRAGFAEASSKAMSAQRGLEYMEQALLTIDEGGVVGLKGTVDQIAKNLAAAAGLGDVAAQFDNRDEAVAFARKGFQNLIPVAFSGTQTGNSISNFDVQSLAEAYVDSMFNDGIWSMTFVTEDKLMDSLKSAMDLLGAGREKALIDMTAIEKTLLGRTLRSGAEATEVIDPYRSIIPQEEDIEVPSVVGNLYRSDDGIYRLRLSGD
jgi:hypothetical protein